MKSSRPDLHAKVAPEVSLRPKSGAANARLQATAASGPLKAGHPENGGGGATASIVADKDLAEESKADENQNTESSQPQASSSATPTSKKRKPSVEGEVFEETSKRSRDVSSTVVAPNPQETGPVKLHAPELNSEITQSSLPSNEAAAPDIAPQQTVEGRAEAATSLAPPLLVAPHGSLLPSSATPHGALLSPPATQAAQLQQLSALNSWAQLPVSVQTALLNSAAASVGPVHPFQPPELASLLALQQATRLAAAGQLMSSHPQLMSSHPQLMSSHPLAGQLFLQHLLGASAGITPNMSMPNYGGPMYPPWAGMHNGAPGVHNGAPGLPPFALQGPPLPAMAFKTDGTALHVGQTQMPGTINDQTTTTMTATAGSMTPSPAPLYPGINGGAVGERASVSSSSSLQQSYTADSIGPQVPESLPAVLALPEDDTKLSSYQILLRNQVEAFSASVDDLATHARGRNKPITLGQVGIRCRHCKYSSLSQRKKGSVYFPFSLLGLYQAAQNMGSAHFHGESCHEMSTELKEKFLESIACKSTVGSGKQYWAKSAGKLGLVDTDHGIRFIRDLVVASS